MTVETDADRLELVSTDDFGVDVILFVGSPVTQTTIQGIFESPHSEVPEAGFIVISAENPVVFVRTSDVSSVVQDTEVQINGTSYTVKDIQPDGTGFSTLQLFVK